MYSVSANWCVPIIFKLDKESGTCDVICLDWLLPRSLNARDPDREKRLDCQTGVMPGFLRYIANAEKKNGTGRRLFIQACVLAGCDYLPSWPGFGTVGAFKTVVKMDTMGKSGEVRVEHAVALMRGERPVKDDSSKLHSDDFFAGLLRDPTAYCERASQAEAVFFYHRVYDASKRTVVPYNMFNAGAGGGEAEPLVARWSDVDAFIGARVEGGALASLGNEGQNFDPVQSGTPRAPVDSIGGWSTTNRASNKPNAKNDEARAAAGEPPLFHVWCLLCSARLTLLSLSLP